MSDEAMLEIRSVHKNFGGLQVLSDVSLTVAAGVRHGLIGPNGAGKTTLMNIVSGLERPSGGRVVFRGDDVTRLTPQWRARRGLSRTFQVASLFNDLPLIENVELAIIGREGMSRRFLRPLRSYTAVRSEARSWLAEWGLQDRSDTLVEQLAHGERRVLEVVMALAADPHMLLLDEPAAGLSHAETSSLADTFRALPDELGFLLVEHNVDMVFGVCERVTVLAEGEVIADGSPQEIRTDPAVREAYLGVDL